MNAKELQEARRAAAEEAARRAAEGEAVGQDDTEDDEDVETVHGSQDATSSDEDISKVARAEAESKVMDQDPRTRILNVLELEGLFISSAPNLDRELPSFRHIVRCRMLSLVCMQSSHLREGKRPNSTSDSWGTLTWGSRALSMLS